MIAQSAFEDVEGLVPNAESGGDICCVAEAPDPTCQKKTSVAFVLGKFQPLYDF